MTVASNRILEVVNDVRTINQTALFVYFSWFLVLGWRAKGHARSIILPDLDRMARCLGAGIWVWAFGAVIIGITIAIHRSGLGDMSGLPAWWTVPPMALGSFQLGLGALLVLRIMSIARYGNILWFGLIAADLVYLASALVP
jgi:hypothetical protein